MTWDGRATCVKALSCEASTIIVVTSGLMRLERFQCVDVADPLLAIYVDSVLSGCKPGSDLMRSSPSCPFIVMARGRFDEHEVSDVELTIDRRRR